MELKTELYSEQIKKWPQSGKHILAQYSDEYVVVYQAYKPSIGNFAVENQRFGSDFSFSRMSWIKTNFLWMMYRSGWGTKTDQEVTLAIYLKRSYFTDILAAAFPSKNVQGLAKDEWSKQVANTDVRLQWDPDHNPYGTKQDRKAIQLGLRKNYLSGFNGDAIERIEDISEFVSEQRKWVEKGELENLLTPYEQVYPIHAAVRESLIM